MTTHLRLVSACLGLAFLFGLASLFGVGTASAKVQGVRLDTPAALPAFALEDHARRPFTPDRLKDGWTLILMGYTHCPDVCPFTLSNLEAVMGQISMRTRPDKLPRVVFLAVDPARDGPILADYVRHFHPDFLGVTGAADQLSILIEGLDGFVRMVGDMSGGSYEVQHSAAISVIGPDGRLHAKLSPPLDPGATAEFLTTLQRTYARDQLGSLK